MIMVIIKKEFILLIIVKEIIISKRVKRSEVLEKELKYINIKIDAFWML